MTGNIMNVKQTYMNASLAMKSFLRSTKSKPLLILAVAALLIPATFLHANSDNDQSDRDLPGTWLSNAEPGVPPSLCSFMSDGRAIFSRTIITPTGPSSFELVGTGHGEWIRTGRDEFAATFFLLRSGPTVDFTGLVKVTSSFKFNRHSDQITQVGTVYIYDAGGNQLFSFPTPGSGVFKRIIAGQ